MKLLQKIPRGKNPAPPASFVISRPACRQGREVIPKTFGRAMRNLLNKNLSLQRPFSERFLLVFRRFLSCQRSPQPVSFEMTVWL